MFDKARAAQQWGTQFSPVSKKKFVFFSSHFFLLLYTYKAPFETQEVCNMNFTEIPEETTQLNSRRNSKIFSAFQTGSDTATTTHTKQHTRRTTELHHRFLL